jgi:oligoendopeptidase F
MTTAAPTRSFFPADLDCADWAQLQPLYQALLDRELDTAEAIAAWLADYSELTAVVSEYGSRRNIDLACHTDDPQKKADYLHFVEHLAPKIKPFGDKLQRKYLDAPALPDLEDRLGPQRFEMLTRDWRNDIELYREANIPLQTELAKLNTEYDALIGAMVVEFRGEPYTLQQLARFLQDPDRTVRQETWELAANRRLQDREAIDAVFTKMVRVREQIAQNTDLDDYRAYAFKAMARFDYTPDDCLEFADAIESVCVPAVAELDRRRQSAMGLEKLRPWDTQADVKGRPALSPFDRDNVSELVEKVTRMFQRVSPSLGDQFATLEFGRNLDLDSRKGKRAGGFQSSLRESKQPFIFMNAAGLQRDVETLLHEGGHAFHFMWSAAAEPLVFLQHAPIEFCEVASMTMELMAEPYLDEFYGDETDLARARRALLEGIVRFFPWMATIDQFQHWIYTHPGHDEAARTDAWLDVFDRFGGGVTDWSGYEQARAARWHAQLHLFHHPFYYVEYGIAQLGALQLWRNYRKHPQRALEQYRAALALGATRPLPELFKAAGIKFDFSRRTIEPLIAMLVEELDALPVE